MLIDKQASPNDESSYIRQSDREILIVFPGHLFTIISPFSKYLRKVLQELQKRPIAEEIISFARQNPTS
jgi:hypothetical protein